jgi:DNA mismatch endonuclease, patch repair protein
MVDKLSSSDRSRVMSRVKGKDTAPEMTVRRLLHALGYRYRLHGKQLPGKPDIVFAARRKLIFVHGCFWHQHTGCRKSTIPDTRRDFWSEKLARNVSRDERTEGQLRALGWDVLVVWECDVRDKEGLTRRLIDFVGPRVGAGGQAAIA